MRRVLCAVDVDETGRRVFAHGLALARTRGSELTIVHAAAQPPARVNEGDAGVDRLRRLRALADAAGVPVRLTVEPGEPAVVIASQVALRRPDLMVIGAAHGSRRGRSRRSLAERLLSEAPCPMLVARRGRAPVTARFERILCAVDLSSSSHDCVQHAVRLAYDGAGVTLLHVLEEWDSDGAGRSSDAEAAAALRGLQALIPTPQRAVVLARVSSGSVVDEIVRMASTVDAQLLVVGLGSRRGAYAVGANTARLIREAPCPVLAVPPARAARLDPAAIHRSRSPLASSRPPS